MALTTDPAIIFDIIRQTGWKYYRVTDSANNQVYSMNDPEMPIDQAIKRLENFLKTQIGLYQIKIYEKSGKENGRGGSVRNNYTYTVQLGNSSSNGSDSPIIAGMTQETFDSRIEEKIGALRKEMELNRKIEDLQRENNELKQGSPWIKHLEPFIPVILNRFGIAPVESTITGNETDQAEINITRQKLAKALQILEKNDPDFVIHLEKIAEISETQPGIYKIMVQKLMQ